MKGKIRKTGEEITIVTYRGGTERHEALDYVSYIDSEGNEHYKEYMNLYWDVEVMNPVEELQRSQLELSRIQVENARKAVENSLEAANRMPSKMELIAANILGGLLSNDKCCDESEMVDRAIRLASILISRLS